MTALSGRWLVAGRLKGDILKLDAALSFWGGFDATTGTIIDRAHPQCGLSLAGKVVAMPGSRGSSGTPGVLGESLRRGSGPRGMLVTKADINLVAGVLTAAALYETTCPILLVNGETFADLTDGSFIDLGA